jgi:hypothetical protein
VISRLAAFAFAITALFKVRDSWTAIKPMLPNKQRGVPRVNDRRMLNASFGSCVQVRHGATCLRPMVLAPPVTTVSFVGGGLASGTKSWMRWPPVTTRRCR